jgi:hypothetical protein
MTLVLALVLAGCAAESAEPTDADCGARAAPVPATLVEDALTVRGASELVLGSQGGWMITPILAVDRAVMASDGACVHVAIEVDAGLAGGPISYQAILPELAGGDDQAVSDELPVFLSYDLAELDGRAATITALVEDDDVASSCQVAVELANRE